MKTRISEVGGRRRGFTLVEMLVVISVIAILAGMLFPITAAVNRTKTKAKTRAELAQVENAIALYKTTLGHYPPDSGLPVLNQLYYELVGTSLDGPVANQVFTTLDGSHSIESTVLKPILNNRVSGFVNSTRQLGDDEAKKAKSFLPALKAEQYAEVKVNNQGPIRLLNCTVKWPAGRPEIIPNYPGVNPWRYVSTNPTNNPGSYDLWVDVVIGGKVFRFSNWSKEPVQVVD
jgi:prepilin-type N-terminal cleavage/methylation domain-containing protein